MWIETDSSSFQLFRGIVPVPTACRKRCRFAGLGTGTGSPTDHSPPQPYMVVDVGFKSSNSEARARCFDLASSARFIVVRQSLCLAGVVLRVTTCMRTHARMRTHRDTCQYRVIATAGPRTSGQRDFETMRPCLSLVSTRRRRCGLTKRRPCRHPAQGRLRSSDAQHAVYSTRSLYLLWLRDTPAKRVYVGSWKSVNCRLSCSCGLAADVRGVRDEVQILLASTTT